MRLSFCEDRVLAIVAHPDDAELLCAGTLARARADGAAIALCVLCRGDKGQPDPPLADLAEVRQREMRAAAAMLGAELFEGGFADSELRDAPEQRQWVVEVVRRFAPTLLLGHAPNDYHADHRAASALAEVSSWLAASSGFQTSTSAIARPPAVWWMDTVEMIDFRPHLYIDVSPLVELKRQLIRCHASQLARADQEGFAPLEQLMLRQAAARGAQSGVAVAEAFRVHRAWQRIAAC